MGPFVGAEALANDVLCVYDANLPRVCDLGVNKGVAASSEEPEDATFKTAGGVENERSTDSTVDGDKTTDDVPRSRTTHTIQNGGPRTEEAARVRRRDGRAHLQRGAKDAAFAIHIAEEEEGGGGALRRR